VPIIVKIFREKAGKKILFSIAYCS
jgi:hypothetical protein